MSNISHPICALHVSPLWCDDMKATQPQVENMNEANVDMTD